MTLRSVVIFIIAISLTSIACTDELEAQKTNERDIAFKFRGKTLTYTDIIGEKDGIFRDLIKINSRPSLYSSTDGENYYTLKVEGSEVKIDCLYSDVRSSSNGIRIRRGICGLDQTLNSEYANSAFNFTNIWQSETSKIDISPLIERGEPIDVLLSENSKIKISQHYSNLSDLENSAPDSIIKTSNSCYSLGKKSLYVVSQKQSREIEAIVLESIGEKFATRNLADEIKNIKTLSCSK